jgi:hypothetical protein
MSEPDLETDFFYYAAEKCGADISMSHPKDGGAVWFNTPNFEQFCRSIHSADHASAGHRLALELECLLMDTKDMPTKSKWWDSAMEALDAWHKQFPYDGPRLGD